MRQVGRMVVALQSVLGALGANRIQRAAELASANAAAPRRRSRRLLLLIHLGLVLTAVLIALPRFGHFTPDSPRYVELALHFRGQIPITDLHLPFACRLLVPYLASLLPVADVGLGIALVSLAFVILAYEALYFYLREMGLSEAESWMGVALALVSFPTFNYGSGVLTDAAGFCLLVVALTLLLRRCYLLLLLVSLLGVLAREASLSVPGIAAVVIGLEGWRTRDCRCVPWAFALVGACVGLCWFVRSQFASLGDHFWMPSLLRITSNLARPVSWATSGLTAGPLVLLAWALRKKVLARVSSFDQRQRTLLVTITVFGSLLVLYSVSAAFMSGRFVWWTYVVVVPLVAGPAWEVAATRSW